MIYFSLNYIALWPFSQSVGGWRIEIRDMNARRVESLERDNRTYCNALHSALKYSTLHHYSKDSEYSTDSVLERGVHSGRTESETIISLLWFYNNAINWCKEHWFFTSFLCNNNKKQPWKNQAAAAFLSWMLFLSLPCGWSFPLEPVSSGCNYSMPKMTQAESAMASWYRCCFSTTSTFWLHSVRLPLVGTLRSLKVTFKRWSNSMLLKSKKWQLLWHFYFCHYRGIDCSTGSSGVACGLPMPCTIPVTKMMNPLDSLSMWVMVGRPFFLACSWMLPLSCRIAFLRCWLDVSAWPAIGRCCMEPSFTFCRFVGTNDGKVKNSPKSWHLLALATVFGFSFHWRESMLVCPF